MISVSWQGVVISVSFVAGAVVSAVFGHETLGMVLAGAAGGMLVPSPLQIRSAQG